MNKTQPDFEREALALTAEIFGEYAEALRGLGLTWRSPELERSLGAAGDQAEIRIYLEDEDGVFDAIEFFVLRGGSLVASADELRAWLHATIDDVIKRRRAHMVGPA